MSASPSDSPLLVTGPPGAPVLAVAEELATRLDRPCISTDAEIEARTHRSVAELLIDEGEAAFREAERVALTDLLDARSASDLTGPGSAGVIAVGGGALLHPLTRSELQARWRSGAEFLVVFVDVTITVAARELGLSMAGPTAVINPRAQWLRMLTERRPVYREFASATVLADGRPVADLAEEVLQQLGW